MNRICTSICGILFLLSGYSALAQSVDDYTASIDSLISTTDVRPFTGVILIAQNGVTRYAKAHGYADIERKIPLKTGDEFAIMSNSKQITAVLLLLEVQKGRVDLRAPIKKYLPNLTQTWADTVTVHQLLNHTHGITDLEQPLAFRAGTDFKYGNLSNILLGKIISFSAKKSYAVLANQLFRRLGMMHTFCYSPANARKLVHGYANDHNVFTLVDTAEITTDNLPAKGIVSTVADLIIWNNQLHHGRLLNKQAYQWMTSYTVTAQHNVFGKEKVGYGYGIRISGKTPIRYIGHTGLGDGFASVNLYFPAKKLSLVVLENQANTDTGIAYYFGIAIKNILLQSHLTKRK